MEIDCLMGTYGRHELVCESLACFLQRSAISMPSHISAVYLDVLFVSVAPVVPSSFTR
jgi:hypothetical protein